MGACGCVRCTLYLCVCMFIWVCMYMCVYNGTLYIITDFLTVGPYIWDRSAKRDLMHVISRFHMLEVFSNVLYTLHASYAPQIGVSLTGLYGSECLINHTFQPKCFIALIRTFIMYARGPLLCKRSQIHVHVFEIVYTKRDVAFTL